MNDPAAWTDRSAVVEHLARELVRGRLGLLLGAGVSAPLGLPDWGQLAARVCLAAGEPDTGAADDPISRIGAVRIRKYRDNTARFLQDVRKALYEGVNLNFETLRSSDLLVAIGALVTSSIRGSASHVITFNFDDILETYLEYYGAVTRSVSKQRYWTGNQDITIFHPHGFLPFDSRREASDELVFGTQEFIRMMETGTRNLWRANLVTLLRTKTFIHIGMSGQDIHLQSLLQEAWDNHAVRDDRVLFGGVRFRVAGGGNTDTDDLMGAWGISTTVINSYAEIPPLLVEVCQEARRQRVERD